MTVYRGEVETSLKGATHSHNSKQIGEIRQTKYGLFWPTKQGEEIKKDIESIIQKVQDDMVMIPVQRCFLHVLSRCMFAISCWLSHYGCGWRVRVRHPRSLTGTSSPHWDNRVTTATLH